MVSSFAEQGLPEQGLGDHGLGEQGTERIHRGVDLEEASRQLELAAHDIAVAASCIGLGDFDEAHTNVITARAAADSAEEILRVALTQGLGSPWPALGGLRAAGGRSLAERPTSEGCTRREGPRRRRVVACVAVTPQQLELFTAGPGVLRRGGTAPSPRWPWSPGVCPKDDKKYRYFGLRSTSQP